VAAQAPAAAPGDGGGGGAGAARASAPSGAIPGLRLLEMGGGCGGGGGGGGSGGGGNSGGGGDGGARAATTVLGDIDEVRMGWAWQGCGVVPGLRRICPLLAGPPACASPCRAGAPSGAVERGRAACAPHLRSRASGSRGAHR